MSVDAASARVDASYAIGATGLLRVFNDADILTAADVHVATTLGRLTGEADETVLLAVALAVRGVRQGSVCIDLSEAARAAVAEASGPAAGGNFPWPDTEDWYAACRASALVAVGPDGAADRPVRLIGRRLYLDRYWRQEELVRHDIAARAARPPRDLDPDGLLGTLMSLFPGEGPDHQRLAAAAAAVGTLTIVAGGPGTGKTTTVARLLALVGEVWPSPPRVALAAPTGKAAARLQQTVAEESFRLEAAGLPSPGALPASTLHRLLGWRPDSHTRFRHDRNNRLPHDVVVVDETSMVSLTMMSRLLEAVRPDASLVLVGDPDQLASVEAGAVLGDLVARPRRPPADVRAGLLETILPDDFAPAGEIEPELRNDVVRLRRVHRFGGSIAELADAVRVGNAELVLAILCSGARDIEFVPDADLERAHPTGLASLRADVEDVGLRLAVAARAGDVTAALAALADHRLLCGHRRGPYGVTRWSGEVERWLDEHVPGYAKEGEWYLGRPLLVTANDYDLKLYNGDIGVVVDVEGRARAAFDRGGEPVLLPTNRLFDVETVHAMTVHRSQGSQFRRVSVLMPPPESVLLTRELFYTAITRASELVRVIGSEEAVRAAVLRPVVRASGLRQPV
ncbi:MAG: exodeoxyribonuclease V subunit alpha [Mycobacteriales bacterium]